MDLLKIKIIRKKRRGFTLIEMVIVITIIGLLSSIAVTKFSKVQENAKLNADYATAANLATAAQMALNDGKASIEPSNLVGDYIQFIPKPTTVKDGKFEIIEGTDGSITVKVGQEKFYPRPDSVATPEVKHESKSEDE